MASVSLAGLMAFPIHPSGWERPKGDLGYRITNHFDGPDLVNGGKHEATDAGNFKDGHLIRAPAGALRARAVSDKAGTKGVEIDFGSGLTVTPWHLNRVDVPASWTPVMRGQPLGLTGNSPGTYKAPNGMVKTMAKHTHLEGRRNGVKFDLEPYLLGQPLPLEDEMDWVNNIIGIAPYEAVVRGQASFRVRPDLSAESKPLVLGYDSSRTVVGTVAGVDFGAGPTWCVFVSESGGLKVFHEQDITRRRPLGQVASADQLKAARFDGRASMREQAIAAAVALKP
jgi:hypothetical protein